LIARLTRQSKAVRIGKGDAQMLGLRSRVTTHARIAICSARFSGIRGKALGRKAMYAIRAETATDVRGYRNAIANSNVNDRLADTLHDAERLVPNYDPLAAAQASFVNMQIGPANCG
jgi:hypothetical protein